MKLKDDSKRLAITNQTIDIVFEKGFSGIKMAGIARQVGISPSTIYVYFKNKDDLIVSISSEIIKNASEMSHKEVKANLPYKLKLKAIWLYWLNFGVNHIKEMSFLHQVKQSPYYDLIPKDIKDEKVKLGNELLTLGKKEGLIKNLDNNILSAVISAILNENVNLVLNGELELNQKDIDLMFSLLWDAIKS